MSLRKTISNECIIDLIVYDPEKLSLENITRALWTEGKVILIKVIYRIVLSSHRISYDIIIFYFLNVRILTQL